MGLVIPDEILQASGMSEEELAREIAVLLFQQGKLALAQASRLAGMSRLQFQHLLASRQIPVHYDVAELEEDLRTLKELSGERDFAHRVGHKVDDSEASKGVAWEVRG